MGRCKMQVPKDFALLALGINGHTHIMPNVFTQKHYWGYAAKNDEARSMIRKWR